MRYRLSTRTLFEGCEPRCGDEARRSATVFGRDRLRRALKRGEPLTGCGVQQTREPVCGANRRGGAKPRGRNEPDRSQSRADGSLLPGVDAPGHVGGGARESHERRTCREVGPTLAGALRRGGQGHEGRRLRLRSGRPPGREPLGGPAGNGERSRRVRERPTTRYRLGGWRSAVSFDASGSGDPEDPVNLTEAARRRLGVGGISRAPETLQRRHPDLPDEIGRAHV